MSQQVKNPFLHQHDDGDHHHHHHHDDGELIEQLDPAQQSLADALRVSFFVLKIVMVVLLVIYLCSGIFWVGEQESAIRLRFGAIVGDTAYTEGWHIGLPYPIEQVIRVPTSPRSVTINQAFMPERAESRDPLNPERDGSLMTGDANVVHGQFSVNYRIPENRVAEFVRSVDDMALADELVRSAAEQGIIFAVAQTDAETFIRGNMDIRLARIRAQRMLDDMGAGIELSTFVVNESRPPAAVAEAFEAVTRAESARSQAIETAREEQTRILGDAAGEAALPAPDGRHGPLLALILEYERASDEAEVERLDQMLDQAFRQLRVPMDPAAPEGETVAIGAQAAQAIQTARSYRTGIVQRIRAEAETVTSLGAQDPANLQLLYSRRWQDAKERIFTGDVETIYSMSGRPYLVTNRDPQVRQEQERRRMQQEQENR